MCWEAELVEHLVASAVPVAAVMPMSSGESLRIVESIENLAFHLTDKAIWRGTESIAEGSVGQGLAELHSSADRLGSVPRHDTLHDA